MSTDDTPFYHGTRAALAPGALIAPGFGTNFGTGRAARHVYFTATLDAAIWGAELAQGDGQGRIYLVTPTGPWHDDPNLTDRKFSGNPTRSYRSLAPLRVLSELSGWQGHPPEVLQAMRAHLARLRDQGIEAED